MKLLIIENGVVVNVIEAVSGHVPSEYAGAPVAPEGVGVGWTVNGESYDPPAEPTLQEIEAEVQALAEEITAGNDRDVAMAMATVDLVMAAVNGNLAGLSKAQVRQAFRDRIVDNLLARRGI